MLKLNRAQQVISASLNWAEASKRGEKISWSQKMQHKWKTIFCSGIQIGPLLKQRSRLSSNDSRFIKGGGYKVDD